MILFFGPQGLLGQTRPYLMTRLSAVLPAIQGRLGVKVRFASLNKRLPAGMAFCAFQKAKH